MPLVSVIIPTYNCEQYIARAVTSVLRQEGCEYELIVIDDGSADQTKGRLEWYSDRLQYIYQDNRGVSAARNHGIQIASGQYIAFLDADDIFLPGKLEAQHQCFEKGLADDTSLGMVHSGWTRVDAQEQVLMTVKPWEQTPDLTLETWLKYKPVLPSAMMFRKDWLERVGGFNPKLKAAEDVDLTVRLALEGCTACWLKEITTGYRQHGSSAMGSGIDQADALTHLLDTVFNHPQLPKHIQLMENQIRYGTLVWIAWYLHHTGQPKTMAEYLKQSCEYSPYIHTALLINWVESFREFSQGWGKTLNIHTFVQLPEWQNLARMILSSS